MAEPELPFWLILLGAFAAIASGIGGLITGAKGLATAKRAEKKVSAMKALDLRVTLTEKLNLLKSDAEPLTGTISSVHAHRLTLNAEDWKLNVGAKNAWNSNIERDRKRNSEVQSSLRALPRWEVYKEYSVEKLEETLGEADRIHLKAKVLKVEYEKKSLENDGIIKQRQEDHRTQQMRPYPPRGSSFS